MGASPKRTADPPPLDPTAIPAGPPPPLPIDRAPDSILGLEDDQEATIVAVFPHLTHKPAPVVRPLPVLEAPAPPPVAPPPAVARPAPLPAPSSSSLPLLGSVVVVDEMAAQLELSRPARLVLSGWVVQGELRVGNHTEAEVQLPENRSRKGQAFTAVDYGTVYARGSKGRFSLSNREEARLERDGTTVEDGSDATGLELVVIRRDADGDEDFELRLRLGESVRLPDPRARLLEIDKRDPLIQPLFTRGLPLKAPRPLNLGTLSATLCFNGEGVEVSDYLPTYRNPEGAFRTFLVAQGDEPFRTAPEDGSTFTVQPGSWLVVGRVLYRVDLN